MTAKNESVVDPTGAPVVDPVVVVLSVAERFAMAELDAPTKVKTAKGETTRYYDNLVAWIGENLPNIGDMMEVTAADVAKYAPKALPTVAKWGDKRSGIRHQIANMHTEYGGVPVHVANGGTNSVKATVGNGILLIRVPDDTYAGTTAENSDRGEAFLKETKEAIMARIKAQRAAALSK